MIETRIDALDFLAQLGDEIVFDYIAEDKTIIQIVTALLALQLHTVPIILGTVQPGVTRSIEVQQDTILGVLQGLRDTVGGYISVDNDRKLNWMNDIGEDKGQQIRYKKNIKGLSRTLEYTNFGNRLYCYGEGEGTARIHLSQAIGMTVDYVEDIPSQGTYGKCIRQLTDKSITDPDVLLAWANIKLAEMKAPRANYTVDMVNLAAMGWDFEALQLGSIVKVIDEDLGIDIEARIVKIIRDLSNPENIKVEISNVTKDIIDTMSGVYDTQQFESHIATKIGAGQVVVLGAFTVADWRSGTTTNINGDFIRTGTIQSTNWGVGAGSQFNLNDGTFKLGGSAAPKLSWNGTTLLIDGYIQVGGAIVPGGAAADVNAYATTISGSKITTNTLDANTIKASSLVVGLTMGAGGVINASSGVKISSTGINIFGVGNALTTRATEAGTIQCYVGADGKFYAGAGAVVLDATGVHITGQYLDFLYGGTGVGGVYGTAANYLSLLGTYHLIAKCGSSYTMTIGRSGTTYQIDIDTSMRPYTTNSVDLGLTGQRWKNAYAQIFRPENSTSGGVILGTAAKAEEGSIKHDGAGHLGLFSGASWHWFTPG